MPTTDDFYKWMKEFHPGIVFAGFQKKLIESHFSKLTGSNAKLLNKYFVRKKILEFEGYWRQKKYAENI